MQSSADPKIAVANQTIDTIVSHLEKGFKDFNISEIIKGGSLGHGTAVPGDYDIDLVIYSRDVTPDETLESKLKPRLQRLHEFLVTNFPQSYTYTRMTQHSLQFDFLCCGFTLAVDLLLGPYWESKEMFYAYLKTVKPEDRKRLTVCAAKWQVAFFKSKPNEVKEYIRRAKAWRNEKWPKGTALEGRPSSYLMSLLVLRAFETRGHRETITQALIRLVQNRQMDVCWTDFYKKSDYSGLLPSRPRMVDPANPANNVWVSGIMEYRCSDRPSNYECQDGNPVLLRQYISSIDLSQPIKV